MPSGSAYQSLIIPPPRRSAPPAAQGGHGPPILIPHSPSTTYRSGAIQSHFAPSQAPSHGTYSRAAFAASAGRAQVPYQHPQAPNPTNQRATGKGTPAQRLAMVLALTRGHPIQMQEIANPYLAVRDVANAANDGISQFTGMFNPNTSKPKLVQGANGGMYPRIAPLPDSLPQSQSETPTVPLPNMQKAFGLRPTTRRNEPFLSPHFATRRTV